MITMDELWASFMDDGGIILKGSKEELEVTKDRLVRHKYRNREAFAQFYGKGRLSFNYRGCDDATTDELELEVGIWYPEPSTVNVQIKMQ